jgi:hypothetical protein
VRIQGWLSEMSERRFVIRNRRIEGGKTCGQDLDTVEF